MKTIPTQRRLLTTAEAEQLLGLSKGLLYKMRCAGNHGWPPYHKLAKRCVRYDVQELERWIESKRVDVK